MDLAASLMKPTRLSNTSPKLHNGSRVAVMGGGPAGSFFAYFLLTMAQRIDLKLDVDVYEPRDFSRPGPGGCNMDAGIISESLVQHMAAEGIKIPSEVVRQGVDSYVLHMDVGSARIAMPLPEKRIASVYRGSGPLGGSASSFDNFCLSMALQEGARLIPKRIENLVRAEKKMIVETRGGLAAEYDLLAVAAGVNTSALRLFTKIEPQFRPPGTVRAIMREYRLGAEAVEHYLGSALHVFLLDLPGLDFAAIVPKYDSASLAFLGTDVSEEALAAFLNAPEVKGCMPPEWQPDQFVCRCNPRMQMTGAIRPYADRLVFVGDSSVSRLYKDGIGAAFRTAKAAARTAVFYGIGDDDFHNHYSAICRSLAEDNKVGSLIFTISRQLQHRRVARKMLLQLVRLEQQDPVHGTTISHILWDTFTGSAPYRGIFARIMHPAFFASLARLTATFIVQRTLNEIRHLPGYLPRLASRSAEHHMEIDHGQE